MTEAQKPEQEPDLALHGDAEMTLQPEGDVPSSSASGGWSIVVLSLVLLCVVYGLTLLALDRIGRTARIPADGAPGGQVHVVPTGSEAIARLGALGAKGIYLVQLSDSSAFAQVDFRAAVPTSSTTPGRVYPFDLVDVQRFYADNLRADNYMLVAARAGIARKVDQVATERLLGEIRDTARKGLDPDITLASDAVRINRQGEVHYVLPRLPDTKESFALLVNASYFKTVEPGALLESLRPYSGRISYIMVSEDEDDPTLDQAVKDRVKLFVALAVGTPQ